jgi:hypothetical protein
MNETDKIQQSREPRPSGRPRKIDPAANRITVRFTDMQYADFLTMFERSGIRSKARFILARIFGEPFRVVKTDSSALDFVMKLSALYGQFRAVGNNYNQTVKRLRAVFGDKKALSMLYELEQQTIELFHAGHEVLALCEEFKSKILPEQR